MGHIRDLPVKSLGIDIGASSLVPGRSAVEKVVSSFPYQGILLSTGHPHLIKAGYICYELLKADMITGSIERFESWEPIEVSRSSSLLLYSNVSEDLVK